MCKLFYQIPEISNTLFGSNVKLLPSVDELFELELANLEYNLLNKDELIERSAFFQSINGRLTKHFQLYSVQSSALSEDRSVQTKSYFENGQFSTGYATHGLFPYRGKFHPQLIKGLINIIGIKKGEFILDPMCGSGTANIEAALMGINSYAVDQSPFCQFMTKTKFEALTINIDLLNGLFPQVKKIKDADKLKIYNLALLAFLDAMGYSMRVSKSSHEQLLEKVLHRYIKTVFDFSCNPFYKKDEIGLVNVLNNSSALKLELNDGSIDGVITSPPYSFAIDYVKNDEVQLKYLGCDTDTLKSKMIGLIGKNKTEWLNNYFRDMEGVCAEISRVLKKGKFFIMIIGSNTNQVKESTLTKHLVCCFVQYEINIFHILRHIKKLRT